MVQQCHHSKVFCTAIRAGDLCIFQLVITEMIQDDILIYVVKCYSAKNWMLCADGHLILCNLPRRDLISLRLYPCI